MHQRRAMFPFDVVTIVANKNPLKHGSCTITINTTAECVFVLLHPVCISVHWFNWCSVYSLAALPFAHFAVCRVPAGKILSF